MIHHGYDSYDEFIVILDFDVCVLLVRRFPIWLPHRGHCSHAILYIHWMTVWNVWAASIGASLNFAYINRRLILIKFKFVSRNNVPEVYFNSLWPTDVTGCQDIGPGLAQVMAWCLKMTIHHLNHKSMG